MSDIFNEYAKLALAQGLISEADEKPEEKSKDINPSELLYGVKPDGEQKSLVEQAHPESQVIAPAYDKVNGLVENIQERQDIMHFIATKPSHGKHIGERYVKAQDDLLNQIIINAFALDRDDQLDLMKLADSCAERLTKTALAPAAGFLGIAAWKWLVGSGAIASWGLLNHFGGKLDAGVSQNAERAIEELQDLIPKISGQSGKVSSIINHIQEVKVLHDQIKQFGVSSSDEDEIKKELERGEALLVKYIKAANLLIKEITSFEAIAQASQKTDSGWAPSWLGDFGVALEKGVDFFWSDDYKDALEILATLRESLSESIIALQNYYTQVKKSASQNDEESLNELLGSPPESQPDPEIENEEGERSEKLPRKDWTDSPYLPFPV